MPIQLFCFGFGIKFEYLVLIGFEINFFKSDMPVIQNFSPLDGTHLESGNTGPEQGAYFRGCMMLNSHV